MRFPIALLILLLSAGAAAAQSSDDPKTEPAKTQPSYVTGDMTGGQGCAPCHMDTKLYLELPGGGRRWLFVDKTEFEKSVHGDLGCTACHISMKGGHHGKTKAPPGFERLAQKRPGDPEAAAACASCHTAVAEQWSGSIHGTDILERGNTLAADCIDCHGNHYIVKVDAPDSPVNLHNQPFTCTECHSETAIVDKFGLKNPMESYQESFHGKKQELGSLESVAVCSSCHGVHDIYAKNDPRSQVNDRNLSGTCGKCHIGASYGFAQAFSHREEEKSWKRVLLIVEKVYLWLILASMGAFLFHMLLDFIRHFISGRSHG